MSTEQAPEQPDPALVAELFKAYDIRGLAPEQLDEPLAMRIGAAFADTVQASRFAIGHDMRPTSPGLARAFARGAMERGSDVVWIGLASTDQLYFATGHLDLPGVMFTASHNPAGYNGIKMARAKAEPIGQATGLGEIRDRVLGVIEAPSVDHAPGRGTEVDLLAEYAAHLVSLAPVPRPRRGRPLRVVADAGNGMAGHTAPAVFDLLADRVELVGMYFELDGTFPHHEANPIDPETLRDLQARVLAEGADLGLAFDGDADRCFLVDETGAPVSPSALTALIAERELGKHPGSAVIHNLITSRAVPELVTRLGGTPVRTRVGHSFIKATMAQTDAVFGGEHSGHFYFRDFWRADSGMLAALHALAALAEGEQPMSELIADYEPYVLSGEINSVVGDASGVRARIEQVYGRLDGVELDSLDGLSVSHEDWAFNVRTSNTEPLLRLNVEGRDAATMRRVRDEVLAMIRSEG